MAYVIREYEPADAAALRACVIALQEFERTLDPALPPGPSMVEAYCERLHARCRETEGRIYVAAVHGAVAGFVAVAARESFTEPDDPAGTYALVSDLVVLEPYRGSGIGRGLLARAEAFAREAGASELRVVVLARNGPARRLYRAAAFEPLLETYAKRW